jgi:hypothetical protein
VYFGFDESELEQSAVSSSSSDDTWIYLLRLRTFAMVLPGILDKNRRTLGPPDVSAAATRRRGRA